MKQIMFTVLAAIAALSTGIVKAQNPATQESSFESAMLAHITELDTASSESTLVALANSFGRIGNAEKTKWQPFYYAACCYTAMAYLAPDKNSIDALADKAWDYLSKAEAIDHNNSEISCLFAMISSCRIIVDPVGRFPSRGKEVNMYLAKAISQNPDNPRIYLLQARMLSRTPEAFGGGKKAGKAAAEKAIEKFAGFKAENSIAPSWGEGQAKSLLEQLNAAH